MIGQGPAIEVPAIMTVKLQKVRPKMKTFTILLAASATMTFSGIASAADTNTAPSAQSVSMTSAAKTDTKRHIVRKELSTKNQAVPTLSDKGWISVSERSPAKMKIIQPQALKSRMPVKSGQ